MSQQLTTLSRESIQFLCGLIRNVSTLPNSVIDNINLANNTTFDSIHITDLINNTLVKANDRAEELCNALTKLTCEKTTTQPTLDNSKINVIYLYSADGDAPFEQYLRISDTELIDMGSTTISLNDYLTVTDAVSTYAKKVDLDTLTTEVTNIKSDFTTHKNDTDIHVTTSDKEKWNGYNDTINEMKTNFQDGVNTIYDSVVARGVTPTDKSPSSIVKALDKTFNNSILIKEYSSDGLKIFDNRGIIEEGGYYKDEKYKICYVNVIYLPKVDLYSDGNVCFFAISGLPMPLIQNDYRNPTFLSIENIDNPNRQCKAGYGIDVDGINGCIFMNPFNKNERVRIYGAYQYSEN